MGSELFENACLGGLDLACVMAANNEIGTIYPIREAARIAKRHGVALLTDATQAVGKVAVDMEAWEIDFLAFSAHKIYGPMGVGALVVAQGQTLAPLFFGGGTGRLCPKH
jgi:cysteine desulfurase